VNCESSGNTETQAFPTQTATQAPQDRLLMLRMEIAAHILGSPGDSAPCLRSELLTFRAQ
jgi:hypothetical protein